MGRQDTWHVVQEFEIHTRRGAQPYRAPTVSATPAVLHAPEKE